MWFMANCDKFDRFCKIKKKTENCKRIISSSEQGWDAFVLELGMKIVQSYGVANVKSTGLSNPDALY